MGYYLEAFICRQADAGILTEYFDKAIKIDLGQGLSLIPMTEELYDQINKMTISDNVDKFEYLTENVERQVLNIMGDRKFAYVEAEYFGGHGGQIAIAWENSDRVYLLKHGQDNINKILKSFGVIANTGQDEFLTLGFGLRTNNKDWLKS